MNETNNIIEGQQWKNVDGWGTITIGQQINDKEWFVDIHTEPMTLSTLMTEKRILEGYTLCEK